jgi:hypothetical protein
MRLNELRASGSRHGAADATTLSSPLAATRIARAPDRAVPKSMAPRPAYGARAVGSYVPRVTKASFEKFGFSTAAMLTEWHAIVGSDLARMTAPDRVKWPRHDGSLCEEGESAGREGATLVLRVDGPRALEIQYKTRQIIDRINAYFGYAAIGAIRILQAPVTAPSPARAPQPATAPTGSAIAAPDLSAVACDGLRAALLRLHRGVADRTRRPR